MVKKVRRTFALLTCVVALVASSICVFAAEPRASVCNSCGAAAVTSSSSTQTNLHRTEMCVHGLTQLVTYNKTTITYRCYECGNSYSNSYETVTSTECLH